ncbi:MAG: FAD-dependent oxidoreductase [Candidatus Latescibacteria bacterium]|jgi:sarcosine oxidase subunit beta|nr:FAD-dependent oxidoreductase [Candidatus Latescibacterota bacterium]
MSSAYDAIIIGAGIVGCSSAFQLAKRGLKVALIDKGNIGAGSTGKSSAVIRQHYSNELTARMALHSLRVFQNFEAQVGGECGFAQRGFVTMVAAKDQAGLEANVNLQQKVGVRTELLSSEALKEIMPGVEIGDLVRVAYEPESGYADPYLTVNAYANAARRHGVSVYLNTEVTDVHFEGDRVVGVETSGGRLDAPLVLNSAGAWGARVAAMVGVEVPIKACRVQVTFFRRPQGYEAPHPVVADFIHATYFRPETGGLTLVGLVDPSEADAVVDPDGYDERADFDFVVDAGERFICRYPPMEHSESTGGYASHYGVTPDWHPIVDEVPAGSGFYICAGFSGHGFKLGPAVGLMVADMLTGEGAPEFDPHLFRFGRYAEDEPVRGQYDYSIIG